MNVLNQLFLLPFPDLWTVIFIVFIAFIIFGINGFGSGLIATPLLAIFIPLAKLIPMLALMSLTGSIINFFHDRKSIQKNELFNLLPLMVVGNIIGAFLVLNLNSNILKLLLGFFAISYSIYSLIQKNDFKQLSNYFSIPFGLIGGIFTSVFACGGFVYMMYLSARLKEKSQERATLSVIISFSSLIKTIVFTLAGVYLDYKIVFTGLLLITPMVIGIYLGRHIHLNFSASQYKFAVNCIIFLSGCTLLMNYFI